MAVSGLNNESGRCSSPAGGGRMHGVGPRASAPAVVAGKAGAVRSRHVGTAQCASAGMTAPRARGAGMQQRNQWHCNCGNHLINAGNVLEGHSGILRLHSGSCCTDAQRSRRRGHGMHGNQLGHGRRRTALVPPRRLRSWRPRSAAPANTLAHRDHLHLCASKDLVTLLLAPQPATWAIAQQEACCTEDCGELAQSTAPEPRPRPGRALARTPTRRQHLATVPRCL